MMESKTLELRVIIPHPNGKGAAQILDRETGKDLSATCTGLRLAVGLGRASLSLEILDPHAMLEGEFIGTMDLKPVPRGDFLQSFDCGRGPTLD